MTSVAEGGARDAYLPRLRNVPVPTLPTATLHPITHTTRYHLAVYSRFLGLPKGESDS